MQTYEEDVALVKSLQDGEKCCIFWFSEMGGRVSRNGWNIYTLDEVTGYGSYENEYGKFTFEQIEEMVAIAHSWT